MKRMIALVLTLLLIGSAAEAELRFACYGDAAEACALATTRYAKVYPKRKTKWTTVAYADREAYAEAWRADPAGFADVALLDAALLDELQGVSPLPCAELEQFAKQLKLDGFSFLALTTLTLNKQLIAVPVSTSARLFYWNNSLRKRAGFELPAQWDELAAIGAKMQAYNDGYCVAADATARMALLVGRLQSKHGRDWLTAQNQCAYTAAELAEGLEWLRQLERERVLAPLAVQGDDALAAWSTGRYACVCLWNADQPAVAQALPDGDTLKYTALPAGLPFDGNMQRVDCALTLSAACADPTAAARFMNYLLNEESGQRALAGALGVPASASGLSTATGFRLLDPDLIAATRTALAVGRYVQPLSFERPALVSGAYRTALLSTAPAADVAQALLDAVNAELTR